MRLFCTGLWEGVTQTSAGACVGVVVVAGLWLTACLLFVTPNRLAGVDYRYWMTVHADHQTEVSFRAMRLAQAGPQSFAVVVFGDSATRDLITDWAAVEATVSKRVGRAVSVYDLSAKGMNLIEMVGLMDLIDDGFNGIVVLQIGQFHLSQTEQELAEIAELPRLALDTPVYNDELARVARAMPLRTGNYFVDHWRYYAHRVNHKFMKQLLLGPIPEHFDPRQPLSEAKWKKESEKITAYLANYKDQRDRNRAILDRMFERLRSRSHAEVVLLELPENPNALRLRSAEMIQDHRRYLQQWGELQGLHYWNLNEDAGLAPDHFLDYVHVDNAEVESRYTDLFADRLAGLAASTLEKDTP